MFVCSKKLSKADVCGPAVSLTTNNPLCVNVCINGVNLQALVDSGSPVSFISDSCNLLSELGPIRKCKKNFLSVCSRTFNINSYIKTSLTFDNVTVSANLLIANTPFPVILGCDVLADLGVSLTFNPPRLSFSMTCAACPLYDISSHLPHRQQNQLKGLLSEFQDRFSSSPTDIGRTTTLKHVIETTGAPHKLRAYRQPEAHQEPLKELIAQMLRSGIIRLSKSPWSSPCFLVKKKDGSFRFIVDYRRLNEKTIKDCFPLPLIDEIFLNLAGCKYFTTFDLASGYWQVELEEQSKAKTAFQANGQLFEFNVLAFGLCNAPASFQRLMQVIFGDLGLLPYIDDLIVASRDFNSHLQTLRSVFQRLREHNLKLRPSKCRFAYASVVYLGHHISSSGIKPDPAKVTQLKAMKAPQSKKEAEIFLGFANYLSRFVRNFSTKMAPIFDAKKKAPFQWTPEADQAFRDLKTELSEDVLLRYPEFNKLFTVTVDASNVALGAILTQDGKPIAYASRLLHGPELKYSATDREYLAVVWALKQFRSFVLGRHFNIFTDHKALLHMIKSSPVNARHARYRLLLEEYDFDLLHISGQDNKIADALSRLTETESQHGQKEQVTASVAAPVSVLPNQNFDENEIISRYHNAGHFSINKVRQSILDAGYDIKKLRAKLWKFQNTCPQCITQKSYASTATRGSLPKMPQIQPLQFVAVDIVGPLRRIGPYRYVLTMIDHASRWLEAIPLARIDAETVAKRFAETWIFRFGAPQVIHSDRGTQFESSVFKCLLSKFNISKSRTTPFWPAGNGIIERVHRSLKDRLRCSQRSWPDALQESVFNINRTIHSSTGSSPFEILFGSPPKLPQDWPSLITKDRHLQVKSERPIRNRTVPRYAALRILPVRSSLSPRFSEPIPVSHFVNNQLLQLIDGRIVNVRRCRLIY